MPNLTFIDNCHGTFNIEKSEGGISPNGCPWKKTPTLLYWDSHIGCYDQIALEWYGPVGEPGKYYSFLNPNDDEACASENIEECRMHAEYAALSTWGWDDQSWWIFGLGDNDLCRLQWFELNYERVRNFSDDEDIFMTIMGRAGGGCWGHEIYPRQTYRLIEHPNLLGDEDSGIIDFLTPTPITEEDILITSQCLKNELKVCGEVKVCNQKFPVNARTKQYTFNVGNPSPSSRYSWHFQKMDGSWLPFTYGHESTLLVSDEIQLNVFLRQDDFGLGNVLGVKQIKKTMSFSPCCADEFERSIGRVFSL